MNILKEFARYSVGALFIFSGIIKVNDPAGTAIKLEEYFNVFAYDIAPFFEWFVPAAMFLSVLLSVLEVVLGVALILGYRMKITAWVLLSMITFFTFLTFYSAFFNKVTDCGCFGDAIKLTPWQSFYKDIVLLVLIVVIFLKKEAFKPWFGPIFREIKVGGVALFMTIIAIYAIRHLPFIDFRAYKVGAHIPTLMMDTAEAEAKITDFGIFNRDGDFTEQILTGSKLVIVIHDVDKSSLKKIDRLRNLTFRNERFETWILTSSGYEAFEGFRHKHQLAAPYFLADATVLKTIVRSNPGVWLLKDGIVIGKWHYNDTPLTDEVINLLNRY